jgi:hypothetical protein
MRIYRRCIDPIGRVNIRASKVDGRKYGESFLRDNNEAMLTDGFRR